MRDDYIRMAKDAGCFVTIGGNDYSLIGLMAIERFAQAVAAHERESCAKECDVVAALRQHPLEHKFRLSAQECATNIRRRQGMTPNAEVTGVPALSARPVERRVVRRETTEKEQ